MPPLGRYRLPLVAPLLALLAIGAAAHDATQTMHAHDAPPMAESSWAPAADEGAFLRENEAAMQKMMRDMAVAPSGDVDRDFVAMMVPHHQGAIDMAEAVLRFGRNEQLRRLAQEIIVTLGDSALGDHALQSELLLTDAHLRLGNLLVDVDQGRALGHAKTSTAIGSARVPQADNEATSPFVPVASGGAPPLSAARNLACRLRV